MNFVALARASASYIMALEFVDSSQAKKVNFLNLILEGILGIFAILIFYWSRDILVHTTVIAVIGGSATLYTFIYMPESPMWLCQHEKWDELEKAFYAICKYNRVHRPDLVVP
jgi:hypothetical protein